MGNVVAYMLCFTIRCILVFFIKCYISFLVQFLCAWSLCVCCGLSGMLHFDENKTNNHNCNNKLFWLTFSTSPITWGHNHMIAWSLSLNDAETCCGEESLCTVCEFKLLYLCSIYPGVPLFTFVQDSSIPQSCL